MSREERKPFSGKSKELRVMTFNIRHGKGLDGTVSLENILTELKKGQADLIALQEVDRNKLRSGFADQIHFFAECLNMQWCFSPSLQKGMSQYGNGILSTYPIVKSRVHFMPGSMERRSVLQAAVQVGGMLMEIMNTHLGVYEEERKQQSHMIQDLLGQVRRPAILMGDFNMEKDHPLMNNLLHNWHKIELQPKTPTLVNGQEIDHIFINFAAKGAKAWTLPTKASDHVPVLAQIPLNATIT